MVEQTQMKIQNRLVKIRKSIKVLEIVWTSSRSSDIISITGLRIVTNQKIQQQLRKHIIKKYIRHNLLKMLLPMKYMNLHETITVAILMHWSQTNK